MGTIFWQYLAHMKVMFGQFMLYLVFFKALFWLYFHHIRPSQRYFSLCLILLLHWEVKWKAGWSCRPLVLFYNMFLITYITCIICIWCTYTYFNMAVLSGGWNIWLIKKSTSFHDIYWVRQKCCFFSGKPKNSNNK